MLRGKGFLGLLVVTVLVALAAALTLDREPPVPEAGALVFPGLLERVNDVTRVDVTSAGETFTLSRGDDAWIAPGRWGHPLDDDKVHNLLVGAAGLTRLQPKTSKPERFAELGLRDPTEKDSRAVGFALKDAGEQTLADLIVGEQRPAKGDPARTEYFVRIPGEARSWLVLGTLPDDSGGLVDWLDRRIIALSAPRISRVEVTHPDGEVVTALRETPAVEDFAYGQLPEGQELDGVWRINDLGRLLTDLSLDDVMEAGEPGGDTGPVEVVTETFDGLRVRMMVWGSKESPRAHLSAQFDPALVRDFQGAAPPPEYRTPEQVRDEVEELTARWNSWDYVIPGYKFDYVMRRQGDLVKKPPEEKKAAN